MKRFLYFTFSILLSTFLLSGCIHNKQSTPLVKERPKIQESVNTVPLEKRVYTTLSFPDSSRFPVGREIRLMIANSQSASTVEYELEYQAGTLVQAGVGSIDPNKEKPPYTRDILLGSCSAGGACSFNEDVRGGTLLLRFKGSEIGNLKSEWNYYAPGNDGKFGSRDAKFQLSAPKFKNSFVIVSSTLGLPAPVEGEVLAGPYNVAASATNVGGIELSIHLSQNILGVKLFRWTGSSYEELPTTISDKTLSAPVTSAGTFLVTQ